MLETPQKQTPSTWTRDNFLISTSYSLLDQEMINAAFDTPDIYWTERSSPEHMALMLKNSFCFGLYDNTGIFPAIMPLALSEKLILHRFYTTKADRVRQASDRYLLVRVFDRRVHLTTVSWTATRSMDDGMCL